MSIWFDEAETAAKNSEDYHESFASHLKSGGEGQETLIFTRNQESDSLQNGFTRLYSHFHSNTTFRGQLRSLEDKFLTQACFEFINDDNILPVLICDESAHDYINKAFGESGVKAKKVSIHNKINLDFCQDPEEIKTTGFLAVQKHFTKQQYWDNCEENCYNFLRLGKLKNELDVAEAILRDAEFIDFNINAIKFGELPSNTSAPVTGLTIEESCQLMKYAGLAYNLKFLSISGYNAAIDKDQKIADCIAMMLWYFIEGREQKQSTDNTFQESLCQEYLIHPNDLAMPLKFYESKSNGQWWVKLPNQENDHDEAMACSKRDYFMACNDEVSERLMQAIAI